MLQMVKRTRLHSDHAVLPKIANSYTIHNYSSSSSSILKQFIDTAEFRFKLSFGPPRDKVLAVM